MGHGVRMAMVEVGVWWHFSTANDRRDGGRGIRPGLDYLTVCVLVADLAFATNWLKILAERRILADSGTHKPFLTNFEKQAIFTSKNLVLTPCKFPSFALRDISYDDVSHVSI